MKSESNDRYLAALKKDIIQKDRLLNKREVDSAHSPIKGLPVQYMKTAPKGMLFLNEAEPYTVKDTEFVYSPTYKVGYRNGETFLGTIQDDKYIVYQRND